MKDKADRAEQVNACGNNEKAGLEWPKTSLDNKGKWNGGPPKGTLTNLVSILTFDEFYIGQAAFDEFRQRVTWRGQPLADHHLDELRDELGTDWRLHVGADVAHHAIRRVAYLNRHHPVRDWLEELPPWDRTKRLELLLPGYVGAVDTPLTRAMGRCFLISSVARILDPGCKVDTVLVLQGKQGCGKSTFVRELAGDPEWYSDTPLNLGDKDSYLGLQGCQFIELSELAATRKRDVEPVKAFISAQRDRVRLPYERTTTDLARQCVFIGTTNEEQFLPDQTGNRRFWPVRVGQLDLEALRRDHAQLWAEALYAYRDAPAGTIPWLLPREVHDELAERHDEHATRHPWEDALNLELLAVQFAVSGMTIGEALNRLEVPVQQQNRGHEMTVAGIMSSAGWTRRRVSDGKTRSWRYFPPRDG